MTIKNFWIFGLVLFFSACAQDRVILMPQHDGSQSSILVQVKRGGEALLDKPYATAETSRNHLTELLGQISPPKVSISNPTEIANRYKVLNNALPDRPKTHIVYFEIGQTVLTSESFTLLEEIVKSIRSLPAPEIVVTGHTDSVGSVSTNDQISKNRALLIRNILIERGVPATKIEAVGRGKRQLLIPTEDNVAEAGNRRVEIRLK